MIAMNKSWIYANYIISAKKDIDSLIYWNEQFEILPDIGGKSFVESKRRDFYVNLCNLLDKTKKKNRDDTIIKSISILRNKKYAHDDDDYIEQEFQTRDNLIIYMKKQLEYVRDYCADDLPEVLTLDYVSYDRMLFRLIHGINAGNEKELIDKKHPLRPKEVTTGTTCFKAFNDVEQIKTITPDNIHEYGVIMEDGLTNEEGLQNRQDSCIRMNILFGRDVWCRPNQKVMDLMKHLKETGFVDEYGIPHIEELSREELKEVKDIFDEFDKMKGSDE